MHDKEIALIKKQNKEQLLKQQAKHDKDINDLQNSIKNLQVDLSNKKGEITNLQNELSNKNSENEELKKELALED